MELKPPIAEISRSYNIQLSFTSDYSKYESGDEILIFRSKVSCGNKEFNYEHKSPLKWMSLIIEGNIRSEILQNIEQILVDAIANAILEKSYELNEEGSNKRSSPSHIDKAFYNLLQKSLYEDEKGWKNAYKTFKSLSDLPPKEQLRATKEAYPNLPEHLINEFADPDTFKHMPSRIAKLHATEIMKLPAQSEEYRKKIYEGKKYKITKNFYMRGLSQMYPEGIPVRQVEEMYRRIEKRMKDKWGFSI